MELERQAENKRKVLEIILKHVNFNTMFTAVCGVAIVALQTCNHSETLTKVAENEVKTDTVAKKQFRNSGRMDTLMMYQKMLLHNDSVIIDKLGL